MPNEKKVKDLMDDIFDYPHLPYWFSIKQAVEILKKTLPANTVCSYPRAILIFDEKYNLLGTLSIRDILRWLEPKIMQASAELPSLTEKEMDSFISWDSLYSEEAKARMEKPVSEAMTPANIFIEPDDHISKVAYLMLKNNLMYLPVLEGKKKLVGVIKMINVFDVMTDVVLGK
jgi:Mg/Co/Ni transporter MgtE